jgi:hypothetical protein
LVPRIDDDFCALGISLAGRVVVLTYASALLADPRLIPGDRDAILEEHRTLLEERTTLRREHRRKRTEHGCSPRSIDRSAHF